MHVSNEMAANGALDPRLTDEKSALAWLALHGLDACEYDDRTLVEKALSLVRPSVQGADAACLAVRAALEHIAGNMARAREFYERARRREPQPHVLRRIEENYAVILIGERHVSQAEDIIQNALHEFPDDSVFIGLRAVIRAREKRKSAKTDIQRLENSSDLSDLARARSYVRAGFALYQLGERHLAEEYNYRAAQIAESIGANRHAVSAYLNLFSIYNNDAADLAASRTYAQLAANAAAKAHDKTFQMIALIATYGLVVEAGEEDTAADLRRTIDSLGRTRLYEFALTIPDAIRLSWDMRYEDMRRHLIGISKQVMTGAQRSIHRALLAVAHLGCDDDVQAVATANAVFRVAKPYVKDNQFEARLRLLGRIVAAGVLFQVERKAEAIRRLNSFQGRQVTLAVRRLATALMDGGYDQLRETAQEVYGYGMLFQRLESRQERAYRAAGLTKKEVQILRLLAEGSTAKEIAAILHLSHVTVDWHKTKILRKLGVKRTINAVMEARRRRIID
jgi:DNA-binding CsgD family transcriptional regulator